MDGSVLTSLENGRLELMNYRIQQFHPARLLTSICFLILAGPASALDGKALFSSCAACHGTRGEGNTKIGAPNLAGMAPWYVTRQLANFAVGKRGADNGDRYGNQMREAVKVLTSDDQRNAVADHVAKLTPQPARSAEKISAADMANGRSQFNAICSSCHGSGGRGNPTLGAPSLIGLDTAYAERQLVAFRDGSRGKHPDDKWGAQMRVGASMLPNAKSIRDVAAYLTTLK